jgi:hypothetical protein
MISNDASNPESLMIIYSLWVVKISGLAACQAAGSPAAAMRLCQPHRKLTNWSGKPSAL